MRKIVLHFFFVIAALLMVNEGFAQSRKVTGQVTGEDGLGLPGASVLIKGTQEGVGTDFDGNYSINVKDENAVLVFQFVGTVTTEKKVGKASVVNVVLKDDSAMMQEVVINTGYQTLSKRKEAGAISRIDAKELKVDGVTDVSRMIEGKAAGVTVQNVTGTFGAAPKITVRGASSIMGDTKPLWVIDGVVQEDIVNVSFEDLASGNSETLLSSAIAGLNADDVLSIDILKDASATAIYGSRAMNGVVVITTKSGRRESPLSISYSMENTVRTVPNYGRYDIMNSQQTMDVYQELEAKGHITYPNSLNGRYGGVYNMYYRGVNNYITEEDRFQYINDRVGKNTFLRKHEMANTNWFKTLFRPAISQSHSLSFSGGGENNAYFASVGYFADPGWTVADKVHRLTMNLKNTFFVNDKFTLALSLNGSVRDQKAPGTYDGEVDVVNGAVSRDFDINPFSYALNTSRTLRPYTDNGGYEYHRSNWADFNILNELESNYMDIDVKDIRFQIDADYKISPKVTYNLNGAARYAATKRVHSLTENSNVVAAYNASSNTVERDQNIYLYKDPNDPNKPGVPVMPNGGMRRNFTNDLTSFYLRNSISYSDVFNDKHELDVFGGTEMRVVNRSNDYFLSHGVQYDKGLTSYPNMIALQKLIDQGGEYYTFAEERERTLAFFTRIGYTYDNRYTVAFTGRYDGSNRQGDSSSSRWLPTWTASGKWNMKQESFLIDNETISNLSLRASYGLTATSGPATNSLAIYRSRIPFRNFQNERENALEIEALQNADLTWEKQYELNLGFDLGLFNNRVQVAFDAYQRNAFDLIDIVRTTGVGGESLKYGNNADMKLKGLEFGITTTNIKTEDFSWTSTINASVFKQEITSLQNRARVIDLIQGIGGNVVGKPRNSLYSYDFTGLNAEGLPTFIMASGETDNVTGANFQDSQNITDYLKYEGSTEPNKTLGFSNTFTYKNWSVNLFFVASGGNKVRLNPMFSSSYSDLDVFSRDMNDRWMVPGDEFRTNVPVIADITQMGNYGSSNLALAYNAYNYSTARIADGDFVRLKNISVAYEFPDHFKKKVGFSNFSLRAMATNPWLIYSDKKLNGQDPEFFQSGGVAMPVTSQYTLTLNVGF
ncbi:SusC/RagA family TonB-linked outer membrane protein [Myroides sp. DF42-4-2]|uniref:SusC/RagA family TonB-linked outer membrane protein n=1 Tax=unclassified Myroides TaxID=2642485 RepID=UPI002574CBEA|nr:SusC/RagA family TonB-linked outer membrane protein [Myroides sp. DF42-4-2]MDM1407146.1 SusC/RagA family TonB-linked outer membrane protein [Myroides sp. DF42-4-2]